MTDKNTPNSYELSRRWFDWCFENPEKISPHHTALYFFAIEHCNRLGWKEKFGFPTQMTMDATGIKKHQTYIKYFNDLCDWGFFELIEKSKNQYSANIIRLQFALPKNGKAQGKALDKASIRHRAKQTQKQLASTGQSTGQSKDSIIKQVNNEQINQEPINLNKPINHKKEFSENVFLFESEHRKLTEEFGEAETEWMINKLSGYKLSKGKEYKSDYGAIRTWVVDELLKIKKQNLNAQNQFTTTTATGNIVDQKRSERADLVNRSEEFLRSAASKFTSTGSDQ